MKILQMDITTVTQGLIGHVVNCQGAMGSGVAKSLYERWPEVRNRYLRQPTGIGMLGFCDIFHVDGLVEVANIYGQQFYGNDGKRYGDPKAVEQGLGQIFRHAIHTGVEDIYLPYKMACDRAGLDWEREIYPIITHLSDSNPLVTVNICVYKGE